MIMRMRVKYSYRKALAYSKQRQIDIKSIGAS